MIIRSVKALTSVLKCTYHPQHLQDHSKNIMSNALNQSAAMNLLLHMKVQRKMFNSQRSIKKSKESHLQEVQQKVLDLQEVQKLLRKQIQIKDLIGQIFQTKRFVITQKEVHKLFQRHQPQLWGLVPFVCSNYSAFESSLQNKIQLKWSQLYQSNIKKARCLSLLFSIFKRINQNDFLKLVTVQDLFQSFKSAIVVAPCQHIDNAQLLSDRFYQEVIKKNPKLMLKLTELTFSSTNYFQAALKLGFLIQLLASQYFKRFGQIQKVLSQALLKRKFKNQVIAMYKVCLKILNVQQTEIPPYQVQPLQYRISIGGYHFTKGIDCQLNQLLLKAKQPALFLQQAGSKTCAAAFNIYGNKNNFNQKQLIHHLSANSQFLSPVDPIPIMQMNRKKIKLKDFQPLLNNKVDQKTFMKTCQQNGLSKEQAVKQFNNFTMNQKRKKKILNSFNFLLEKKSERNRKSYAYAKKKFYASTLEVAKRQRPTFSQHSKNMSRLAIKSIRNNVKFRRIHNLITPKIASKMKLLIFKAFQTLPNKKARITPKIIFKYFRKQALIHLRSKISKRAPIKHPKSLKDLQLFRFMSKEQILQADQKVKQMENPSRQNLLKLVSQSQSFKRIKAEYDTKLNKSMKKLIIFKRAKPRYQRKQKKISILFRRKFSTSRDNLRQYLQEAKRIQQSIPKTQLDRQTIVNSLQSRKDLQQAMEFIVSLLNQQKISSQVLIQLQNQQLPHLGSGNQLFKALLMHPIKSSSSKLRYDAQLKVSYKSEMGEVQRDFNSNYAYSHFKGGVPQPLYMPLLDQLSLKFRRNDFKLAIALMIKYRNAFSNSINRLVDIGIKNNCARLVFDMIYQLCIIKYPVSQQTIHFLVSKIASFKQFSSDIFSMYAVLLGNNVFISTKILQPIIKILMESQTYGPISQGMILFQRVILDNRSKIVDKQLKQTQFKKKMTLFLRLAELIVRQKRCELSQKALGYYLKEIEPIQQQDIIICLNSVFKDKQLLLKLQLLLLKRQIGSVSILLAYLDLLNLRPNKQTVMALLNKFLLKPRTMLDGQQVNQLVKKFIGFSYAASFVEICKFIMFNQLPVSGSTKNYCFSVMNKDKQMEDRPSIKAILDFIFDQRLRIQKKQAVQSYVLEFEKKLELQQRKKQEAKKLGITLKQEQDPFVASALQAIKLDQEKSKKQAVKQPSQTKVEVVKESQDDSPKQKQKKIRRDKRKKLRREAKKAEQKQAQDQLKQKIKSFTKKGQGRKVFLTESNVRYLQCLQSIGFQYLYSLDGEENITKMKPRRK